MRVGAFGGVALDAARHEDVLVITIAGAVTTGTYGRALDRATREMDSRPIAALIMDITRAAPLSEWADGWQSAEGFCRFHHLPCGLVIPRRMAAPISSHCFRVAAMGVTWVAFLRLGDALDWASTWAPHPVSASHQQPRYACAAPPVLH
jgi:hypothetical protein